MTELDTKPYLDYLDKEMAIMGILSAVSVIAPGGILSALLASEKGAANSLWSASSGFVLAGAILCIIAALYFYKERSGLAWYYGQICLKQTLYPKNLAAVRNLMQEADSWESWWPYSCAFTFLVAGFVEYVLAAMFYLVSMHLQGKGAIAASGRDQWLSAHLLRVEGLCFLACPLVSMPIAVLQWQVLKRYKFTDEYWIAFRNDLFSRKSWAVFWKDVFSRRRKRLGRPHDNVFTRLKRSETHGVGVFAIKPIVEGDYVFVPDDSPTISVREEEIKNLDPEIQHLYEDFCVLKEGIYECPSSFNQLTPSWYLNHSETPNVAPDGALKFFALRSINSGEELTTDYDTYSENGLPKDEGRTFEEGRSTPK